MQFFDLPIAHCADVLCVDLPLAGSGAGAEGAVGSGFGWRAREPGRAGKEDRVSGDDGGVVTDPGSGDVYMVVCDQGLWKSTDLGKTFARVIRTRSAGGARPGLR